MSRWLPPLLLLAWLAGPPCASAQGRPPPPNEIPVSQAQPGPDQSSMPQTQPGQDQDSSPQTQPGPDQSSMPQTQPGPDAAATSGSSEQGTTEAAPDSEVTIDDARANFGAIVETFMLRMSPNGFWPLRDKKTARMRHLQLIAVNPKRVSPAGRGRFKGPATLRDLTEEKTLNAEFVVDLTGAEWRVVGMRLLLPKAAKKPSGR